MVKLKSLIVLIIISLSLSKLYAYSKSDLIEKNKKLKDDINWLVEEQSCHSNNTDKKILENIIIRKKVEYNKNEQNINNWDKQQTGGTLENKNNQNSQNNQNNQNNNTELVMDNNKKENNDSDKGNSNTVENILNNESYQTYYEELERKCAEKSNEIANLVIAMEQTRNKLAVLEKKLVIESQKSVNDNRTPQEIKEDKFEIKKIQKKIKRLEMEMNHRQRKIDKVTEEISENYKNLGMLFQMAENVGDPVDITTGEYISEYIDFVAEDFLDEFIIKRNYKYMTTVENYGNNWESSLDSRIIRCNFSDLTEAIENVNDIISICKNIKKNCNEFEAEFNTYTYEIANYYDEADKNLQYYNDELNTLIKLNEINKVINEKNKYAARGKYKDLDKYYGFENNLILLDENGFEHHFIYENNGFWKDVIGENSVYKGLQNLNQNGSYSDSKFSDGGYELQFKSGEKIYYSNYGILERKIDRNNNKTIYKNIEGYINEITLKTGEHLQIKRNDNHNIISVEGNVSGKAIYEYDDKLLTKVVDNRGIEVNYKYDDKDHLKEIIKADGNSVKINYEYNSEKKKYICVSITNENNDIETFDYDFKENIVYHKYFDTGDEYYKIGDDNNTFEYKDYKQIVTKIERNENGQIENYIINGNKKTFEYNDNGLIKSILFSNGKKEEFIYNERNQIIKTTDNDGLCNRYEYDNYGNLIKTYLCDKCCGEYKYYANGLISEVIENNVVYYYKYNKYGNVIEKKINYPDGISKLFSWEYDYKNRLKSYLDDNGEKSIYEYEDFMERTVADGLETTNIYNSRGWLIKEITRVIETGHTIEKDIIYDGKGNVIQILIDNKIFAEYEYYKNGITKAYTVWNNPNNKEYYQGIKIEYLYDKNWNLIKELRSSLNKDEVSLNKTAEVKTLDYKYYNDKTIVTIKEPYKIENRITYDKSGRIIRKDIGDDYIIYNYSPAGRMIQQRDNNFNLYKYNYNKDGSFNIIYENNLGNSINNYYDQLGRLKRITDKYGVEYKLEYDVRGNLVNEKTPYYDAIFKYDENSRMIFSSYKGAAGEQLREYSILYNDDKKEERICVDNTEMAFIKRDVFNRVIESNDINGHYYFKYDNYGNRIKIIDFYGNEKSYEFSPFGEIISIVNDNGNEKKYEYDLMGNLLKVYNKNNLMTEYEYGDNFIKRYFLGNISTVTFDENKKNIESKNYDSGVYTTKYLDNQVIITDNYGNEFIYNLDKLGRVISETNPLGEIRKIAYDNYGKIKEIINYSGKKEKRIYDIKNNSFINYFHNGEKVQIKRDGLGNIIEVNKDNYNIKFTYDKKGNLTSEYTEMTDTLIEYKYDNLNRCIEKSGAKFRFSYLYDEMGHVIKVIDNYSGQWVSFEYEKNKLTKKIYSNGCSSSLSYNDNGQMEFIVSRNKFGSIIHGDFLCYDDNNRVSIIANKYGEIRCFKYDDKGRLKESIRPVTEKLKDFYCEEATECGFFINEEKQFSTISLTEERNNIYQLYKKAGVDNFINIPSNQKSWNEKYSYDNNGNLISIENPYGKINYEYDNLNRIISKNYNNTNSEGIHITWNKDNCLEEYKSKVRKITFIYGVNKRPIKIINENLNTGEQTIKEYIYDGLNRRVIEKQDDNIFEYIYDGLSSHIISKHKITNSGYILPNFFNNNMDDTRGIKDSFSQKYEASSEYREVDQSKYKAFGTVNENNISKKENVDNRSYNILGIGGIALIVSALDSTNTDNSVINFPITNYSNEIIGYVNISSDLVEDIEYDTWGNIFAHGTNISFTGAKNKDNDYNFLFNLGQRDYFPLIKSFTTEDPYRDGMNWFSYCLCDPINYEDNYGLKKEELLNSDIYFLYAELSNFLTCNSEDYNEAVQNNEDYMNMPTSFDCADTVAGALYTAYKKIETNNLNMPSEIVDFGNKMENGDVLEAKDLIDSSTIRAEKICSKIIEGYDRDFMVRNLNSDKYKKAMEYVYSNRKNCIEKLKEPGKVRVGDCIAWATSTTPAPNSKGSCDHTALILNIHVDENGIPIGFVCLEGHLGEKATEITYISIEPREGCYSLDDYMGDFSGVYRADYTMADTMEEGCGK